MTSYEKRFKIISLHADPESGSLYWIDFFRSSGISLEDAADNPLILPPMDAEILRNSQIEHFIPKAILQKKQYLVTGETSGFSGKPIMTAFNETEFDKGFVEPFIKKAEEINFPVRSKWLWAGPSGPHIIGKALRAILHKVEGIDPFSIDFDPRWYKCLPADSMSATRYLKHIENQIFAILTTQEVDVIFSTPPVIRMLMKKMSAEARNKIKGVHYGGIATDFEEYQKFNNAFPNAVHLNGYGNSLFGVFIEDHFDKDGIEYNIESDRVDLELITLSDDGSRKVSIGETGQVMLSRYDETFLIINMLERDYAVKTEKGIKNPHPLEQDKQIKVIY